MWTDLFEDFSDSSLCTRYHASTWRLSQPHWKICSSNWIISAGIGMKIPKIFELPPPRLVWDPRLQFFVVLQDSGQKLSPGLGQETQETQNTSAFILVSLLWGWNLPIWWMSDATNQLSISVAPWILWQFSGFPTLNNDDCSLAIPGCLTPRTMLLGGSTEAVQRQTRSGR